MKNGQDGWLVLRSSVQQANLCDTDKRHKTAKNVRALFQLRPSPMKQEWFVDFKAKSIWKNKSCTLGLHTAELAKNTKLGKKENASTVRAVQPDSGSPLWTCSKERGWDSTSLFRIHKSLYTGIVQHSTVTGWRSLCTARRQWSEIRLHKLIIFSMKLEQKLSLKLLTKLRYLVCSPRY